MAATITELSEKLEVSESCLRQWERAYNVSVKRGKKGHREYDEQTVSIFKLIKTCKASNLDDSEVVKQVRLLQPLNEAVTTYKASPEEGINSEALKNDFQLIVLDMKTSFENALEEKISSVSSLAMDLQKASYRLGSLETENRILQSDKDKLETTTEALKAKLEEEKTKSQNESLEKQKLEHDLVATSSELEAVKSKKDALESLLLQLANIEGKRFFFGIGKKKEKQVVLQQIQKLQQA